MPADNVQPLRPSGHVYDAGPLYATRRQVADAAKEWTDQACECRKLNNHDWGPSAVQVHSRSLDITERCRRGCGCTRSYVMTRSGHVTVPPVTKYPDGYLMPPGMGRVTGDARDAVRAEWATRLVDRIERGGGTGQTTEGQWR
jgi:hypothetical protein